MNLVSRRYIFGVGSLETGDKMNPPEGMVFRADVQTGSNPRHGTGISPCAQCTHTNLYWRTIDTAICVRLPTIDENGILKLRLVQSLKVLLIIGHSCGAIVFPEPRA